ncbi:MAG: YesL family protein [Halanaerobiaceae bacterium]
MNLDNLFNPDSKLFRFFDWIYRVVIINLLWLLFSVLGLVIFGIGPATAASFYIYREFIRGNEGFSTYRVFWQKYKSYFFRVNILTIIMLLTGAILYLDLEFFFSQKPPLYYISYLFLGFSFIYIIIFIHLYPIYTKYEDLGVKDQFRNTFFYSFLNPFYTLLIFFATIIIPILFLSFPGTILFGFPSSLFLGLSWLTEKSFDRAEDKFRQLNEEENNNSDDK